jgi:basic amino acid/polyamine antiporter, APA family
MAGVDPAGLRGGHDHRGDHRDVLPGTVRVAGYLNALLSVPAALASAGLLLAVGALAVRGISESARTAAALTVLEVAGLGLVIWFGRRAFAEVAEEARNPSRTMPVAILLALVISTVLYLLVVVVSTTVVAPAELAGSDAPQSLVVERSGTPGNAALLAGIGMLAAVNGVIVQLIMG